MKKRKENDEENTLSRKNEEVPPSARGKTKDGDSPNSPAFYQHRQPRSDDENLSKKKTQEIVNMEDPL